MTQMNDTFEHTTCDENISCRDFPDLDRIVYDGTIDNNHLMKVFVPNQKKFLDEEENIKKKPIQEAKLDHRIQPETESMIKMILETPFVVSSGFVVWAGLKRHRQVAF